MIVKICGITNLTDAQQAIESGADALGFNFYWNSTRYISPVEAQVIARHLPASVWRVGIFVNHSSEEVRSIALQVGLDTLQFHGNETDEFCNNWRSHRVIKAVRIADSADTKEILKLATCCDHLLFDCLAGESYGGTGKQIPDETLITLNTQNLLKNALVSGGLNAGNVARVVAKFSPFGVDVASGVEESPGKKSHESVTQFIRNAKGAR